MSFILWYFTKTSSLRCDNRGLWEAAGCHQQKAASETMLGLCASVWAQCEGATEVRKGKADSVFTPAGKGCIPPGFFIFRKGRAKKKKKEGRMTCQMPCCLVYWHAQRAPEGPLYCTVNQPKVWWIIGLLHQSPDNKLVMSRCLVNIQSQQIIYMK